LPNNAAIGFVDFIFPLREVVLVAEKIALNSPPDMTSYTWHAGDTQTLKSLGSGCKPPDRPPQGWKISLRLT
jgi:hypothetical protein